MIQNDIELQATQERLARFQQQLAHLRKVETNPTAFRVSVGWFIAEIDRMQLEVREYLASLPAELKKAHDYHRRMAARQDAGCRRARGIDGNVELDSEFG